MSAWYPMTHETVRKQKDRAFALGFALGSFITTGVTLLALHWCYP